MIITNDTTSWQVAELMGPDADERDGAIMVGLLLGMYEPDTDAISESTWIELSDRAAQIRRDESGG
jgi:hypothetical protein